MPNTPSTSVNMACQQAMHASFHWGTSGHTRATVLDSIAAALITARLQIITSASEETALTIDELDPEFDRMIGTLRMFAAMAREGSWVRAAISRKHGGSDSPSQMGARAGGRVHAAQASLENQNPSPSAPALIGPNHDVRSMLVPLGPVAVFGSSNFPLAYGVCGGDTASALAAGCPVIIKEHPAHPLTGRLLYAIASAAATAAGAPDGLLGYIHNTDASDFSAAKSIIAHYAIRAVGFTGSTAGGLALQKLSHERRSGPIPVFAEMGSMNCVFIWPAAFARRGPQIAQELASAVLMRAGQQCTKPGAMFVVGNNEHWALHRMMCEYLLSSPPRRLLARSVADNYYHRLDIVSASQGVLESTRLPTLEERRAALGVPVVIAAADTAMEDAPEVWDEIFGPAIIVGRTFGTAHFYMRGALTATIYAEPEDIDGSVEYPDGGHLGKFTDWFADVRKRAGRIIFNGPPTGVRVAPGMVHGGPFPATNRPDTTAVGPRAIERWCRPICWQNAPQSLLPPELQDHNPLNIRRDETSAQAEE